MAPPTLTHLFAGSPKCWYGGIPVNGDWGDDGLPIVTTITWNFDGRPVQVYAIELYLVNTDDAEVGLNAHCEMYLAPGGGPYVHHMAELSGSEGWRKNAVSGETTGTKLLYRKFRFPHGYPLRIPKGIPMEFYSNGDGSVVSAFRVWFDFTDIDNQAFVSLGPQQVVV